MYWICFGDSALGMLRCAHLKDAPDDSHFIDLPDDLSIGDISDLNDREARAFGICPWKDDPEFAGESERQIERYYLEALPLLEAVDEALIWYGDNPAEQCGMLRAAHELYARGVPFSLAHVDCLVPPPRRTRSVPIWQIGHTPKWHDSIQKRNCQNRPVRIVYRGTGELDPEDAPVFYRKRRCVPDCEAKLLSARWEALVRENAPLRVMRDGRPVSASAEYYDEAILAAVPAEERSAAFVVGSVLAQYAVSDCLIFARIRALGAAGKLAIGKDGGNYRETTVRKADRG